LLLFRKFIDNHKEENYIFIESYTCHINKLHNLQGKLNFKYLDDFSCVLVSSSKEFFRNEILVYNLYTGSEVNILQGLKIHFDKWKFLKSENLIIFSDKNMLYFYSIYSNKIVDKLNTSDKEKFILDFFISENQIENKENKNLIICFPEKIIIFQLKINEKKDKFTFTNINSFDFKTDSTPFFNKYTDQLIQLNSSSNFSELQIFDINKKISEKINLENNVCLTDMIVIIHNPDLLFIADRKNIFSYNYQTHTKHLSIRNAHQDEIILLQKTRLKHRIYLMSADNTGFVKLWDPEDMTNFALINTKCSISGMDISTRHEYLVVIDKNLKIKAYSLSEMCYYEDMKDKEENLEKSVKQQEVVESSRN
jgi:hypothetical protein